MATFQNFIGGRFVPARSGKTLASIEPATGAPWATLPDSAAPDVDDAVRAAADAFPFWSRLPVAERSRILLAIADGIDARADELARVESTDTGKPMALARRLDIPRAAANFRFFATAILHTHAEAWPTDARALNVGLRTPRGVAALIAPWNLPLYLMTWKVAPALAAGNTAVAKPSELAGVTAILLAEIAAEAGLPPGVLNVVHGRGSEVGAPLVSHPEVACVSFTGGTATGAAIATAVANTFRPLTLELGGKNPAVIFADADFDRMLDGAVASAFTNQGEICLCGSRILVERSVMDHFLDAFVARVAALRLGDPLEADTDQGALISAAHRDAVLGHVALAQAEGATVHCGGTTPDPATLPARCREGFFVLPTVLSGLDMACRTNQEEIFGPVVTVTPFDTDDEAIALANTSRYGLAASVWTSNLPRAHRVSQAIRCGTVWVNCWLLRDLRVPFGGVGQSGLGREGGTEALHFFTEQRTICFGS